MANARGFGSHSNMMRLGSIRFDATPGNIVISNSLVPPGSGTANMEASISDLVLDGKTLAVGFMGLCAITSILALFWNIAKLGAAGDNERERRRAWVGILVSGLALSIFGGLSVVVGLFWNALG